MVWNSWTNGPGLEFRWNSWINGPVLDFCWNSWINWNNWNWDNYVFQFFRKIMPLLHVTGPSHGPWVHIPHSASIPSPLGTVTVSAWKGISREVVRNSSCVSKGHYWQLAKDVFDWENIKDRVLRVKLIYDSGAYWFQPGLYMSRV